MTVIIKMKISQLIDYLEEAGNDRGCVILKKGKAYKCKEGHATGVT